MLGNTNAARRVVYHVAPAGRPAREDQIVNLTAQLKAQNEAGRARISDASLSVMDEATAQLRASGIVESSLQVGEVAADFVLPLATGDTVVLSDLLARGPVVLAFYRGGWCPYCSTELRALQARLGEFTAAGASLVAISPQVPDNSLSTAEKLALEFLVASDVGNVVAQSYGLVFSLPESLRAVYQSFGIDLPRSNGDETFRLPIPATFVIAPDGTITWRFVDADYTKRAEPDDVIAAVLACSTPR